MRTLLGLTLGLMLATPGEIPLAAPPAPPPLPSTIEVHLDHQTIQWALGERCIDPLVDLHCDSAQMRLMMQSLLPDVCFDPPITERPYLLCGCWR